MVAWQVVALREREPEKACGGVECCRDHCVERQVRPDLGFIDVVARLALLLRIIAPVPRLERSVDAVAPCQPFERIALLPRALQCRRPNLVEQRPDLTRCLGHRVVERIGRKGIEAEQPCELGAKLDHFGNNAAIVARPAPLTAADPCLERFPAQVSPDGVLQEALDARSRQRNDRLVESAVLACSPQCGLERGRQPLEIARAIQDQIPVLLVLEDVLVEHSDERGEPLVDQRHTRLGLGTEAGTGVNERLVGALEHAAGLRVQPQTVAALIEVGDALEQLCLEQDLAPVTRKFRRDIALDRLELRVGVGSGKVEEHIAHPFEKASAPFEGCDGVVEGRLCRTASDGAHLTRMLGQRNAEGWREMRGLNGVECRHAKCASPRLEQRIGRVALGVFAGRLGAPASGGAFRRRPSGRSHLAHSCGSVRGMWQTLRLGTRPAEADTSLLSSNRAAVERAKAIEGRLGGPALETGQNNRYVDIAASWTRSG